MYSKPPFLTDKLIRDYARKVPIEPDEFEQSFMDYVIKNRMTLDSRYIKDKLASHVEFLKKFPPAEKWKFDDSEFTGVAHKVIGWLKTHAIKDQYGHSFCETAMGIPIDRSPDEKNITEALLRKWVTYEQLRDLCFYWVKYPKIPHSKEEWAEQILWAKTFR
jgi:hypothetical protein